VVDTRSSVSPASRTIVYKSGAGESASGSTAIATLSTSSTTDDVEAKSGVVTKSIESSILPLNGASSSVVKGSVTVRRDPSDSTGRAKVNIGTSSGAVGICSSGVVNLSTVSWSGGTVKGAFACVWRVDGCVEWTDDVPVGVEDVCGESAL